MLLRKLANYFFQIAGCKSRTNSYGHVAIISAVEGGYIEIIQQNAGKYATSRDIMELIQEEGKWVIKNDRVLGWLRIKN